MEKIGIIFMNAKVLGKNYEHIAVRTRYKEEDYISCLISHDDIEFEGLDVYVDETGNFIDEYEETELFYYA